MPQIIEIKAHCPNPEKIRSLLQTHQAEFKGVDHQIDTYFVAPNGRLKLRQGTIEQNLIHYQRPNHAGPKLSKVQLYKPGPGLKAVLTGALGVLVEVDKQRGIYFIENVKFHVDEVKDLGSFVEIEAIDTDGSLSIEHLQKQCDFYLSLFEIGQDDLIDVSYSDLLMDKNKLNV